MSAPLKKIASSGPPPKQADVVVIGGGVIGVCAAYYLAKHGTNVALIEKGVIGGEQSSRNWGWCRQQNRDARELPMATQSLACWDELTAELGPDLGFQRCGLLYLSNSDAEIDAWAQWRDFAATQGVVTNLLSAREASKRGAMTGRRWKGGVFSPTDGVANPASAAPTIAQGVVKHGGSVHQRCAARGIEMEAGRVCGVITEHGVIKTRQVVMAGGAWASSFCRQIGVTFPQASIRASILSVAPGPNDLPDALHTSAASITRRGDGGYTLAVSGLAHVDPTPQQLRFAGRFLPMFAKRWRILRPGGAAGWRAGHETRRRWALDQPTPMEQARVLDPKPSPRLLRLILKRARALAPSLKTAPVQASWAGFIDSTPDGVPVIDPAAGPEGFLLAAGFSGHGFGIGPGAGRLIANLITGDAPSIDWRHYALSRFNSSSWGAVADF